jgi:hypothetical protein
MSKLFNSKQAVLVSLNIGTWANNAIDRAVSAELAEQKNLSDKTMARVWKTLLKKNEYLDAVKSIESKARRFHIMQTFPWVHDGTRILATKNYMFYMEFMRATKLEFELAVKIFGSKYEGEKLIAETALNSIFKDGDYPTVGVLLAKFHFSTVVMPVPNGTMFEAEVESEEASKIRSDIETQVQETFRQASRDNWDRFYAIINRVQERLSDPKGVKEATLQSLRDMLQFLDRMNVTGDERLEALRKQAEERLAGFTAKDLNASGTKKAIAVAQAAQIESSMAALMGGTARAA